ncbi:protein ARV1 [Aethina tumida]|uniref:protein ARV1 n=1 Tax=Aethina tumida TaxID=116153 RepID=UPI0021487295|nr:protein ARV1 [Aethina tumida]
MTDIDREFTCINCGRQVQSLYKKYSETVLKLTECSNCCRVSDKYIEYDVVLVIIDAILLRICAFRHLLHNTMLKNFWKVIPFIILMETYTEWILVTQQKSREYLTPNEYNISNHYFNNINIYLDDMKFYKLAIIVSLRLLAYIIFIYSLSKLYSVIKKRKVSFTLICKTVTLSNSGIFLLLPSIIWDLIVQDINIQFVFLYTTLSQLIAYTAATNCQKIWSIVVILSAIMGKKTFNDYCIFNFIN